ncbi:MAG: N-formylglutamate deformylase [Alphaproteobacteria bacterium]
MTTPDWLEITRGDTPLILSQPHTGTEIPSDILPRLTSPWLAHKDADWWIEKLYDFAAGLGATVVRTKISRTVIDVNRDPSGASLYPGQTTTGLCPAETFDGEPLYLKGEESTEAEIVTRRENYFVPYHAALETEIKRLRAKFPSVVLYDCHSIRSTVPRLFDGILPNFNIGTNSGASCAPDLEKLVEQLTDHSSFTRITNGRFKGGWITRHYGQPKNGVHALQMELACRGYMEEPHEAFTLQNWPAPYNPSYAEPLRAILNSILSGLRDWANSPQTKDTK